jgi:hypothetical protein
VALGIRGFCVSATMKIFSLCRGRSSTLHPTS